MVHSSFSEEELSDPFVVVVAVVVFFLSERDLMTIPEKINTLYLNMEVRGKKNIKISLLRCTC